MSFSRDIERDDDQYLQIAGLGYWGADWTLEWWLKPESLPSVGQSYYLLKSENLSGNAMFHVRLFNDAGTLKLRAYGQTTDTASPTSAQFFLLEWDISALVSAVVWEYLALTFDHSAAVATTLELFHGDESTSPTSQGNGTALSGGTGATIGTIDNATWQFGTPVAGTSYDGLVFRHLMWTDIRTLSELQDNYKVLFQDPPAQAGANFMQFLGGAHDVATPERHNNVGVNGTQVFVADVPSGMNMEPFGTPGGPSLDGHEVNNGPGLKRSNGGYRAQWVGVLDAAEVEDGPGRKRSDGGYRAQWVGAFEAEVLLLGATAASAGAGTTFPPLQTDHKSQFLSTEPLEVSIGPTISALTGQYITSDVVSVVVVKPDNTLYGTPPVLTLDGALDHWQGEIDPADFQEGEWLFYFTSDNPNGLPQWLMLWWGDYVDDIAEVRQAALGRWRIVGSQLLLYEEDGTTVFRTFDLRDNLGDPTSTNIFDKDPVP